MNLTLWHSGFLQPIPLYKEISPTNISHAHISLLSVSPSCLSTDPSAKMIKNLLVLFLVVMIVSSCCMARPQMVAVGGIFGQEQQHHVEKGVTTMEGRSSAAKTSAKGIDNHHNIPRQDWGSASPPGDGSGDGGSG